MKKVVIQFNNGKRKTFKLKGEVMDLNCGHLNYYLLLRYKELQPVQRLMENDAYLKEYAKFSVLNFFCASIKELYKLDGRTKEAKKLPWFSAEEFLANFQ